MKVNIAKRMAITRMRGQIYEAQYALRCIPHSGDCPSTVGAECSTRIIGQPGARHICDVAKQNRRIKTLEELLANLLKEKS